ncbi:MAG: hypothetical protein AAF502_06785 [Bacteroidota bacterium]
MPANASDLRSGYLNLCRQFSKSDLNLSAAGSINFAGIMWSGLDIMIIHRE